MRGDTPREGSASRIFLSHESSKRGLKLLEQARRRLGWIDSCMPFVGYSTRRTRPHWSIDQPDRVALEERERSRVSSRPERGAAKARRQTRPDSWWNGLLWLSSRRPKYLAQSIVRSLGLLLEDFDAVLEAGVRPCGGADSARASHAAGIRAVSKAWRQVSKPRDHLTLHCVPSCEEQKEAT